MKIEIGQIESPIGEVVVACEGPAVVALHFGDHHGEFASDLSRRFGDWEPSTGPHAEEAALRLRDYFGGDLRALDALEVDPAGTPFQRRVWAQLRTIPVGRTASYRDIAVRIGAPAATRAVGAANGANPIGIIIPCHRVIGANGTLTGYGGGLERKRWLLEHEGVLLMT
jgi:methylated-DNA-[protein]-cysteine S-methyltransferase